MNTSAFLWPSSAQGSNDSLFSLFPSKHQKENNRRSLENSKQSKARCDILRVNNFPETLATQPPFLAAYKAAPANLLVTQRPGFHLNTHTGGSAHLLTVQGNFSLLSLGCRYRYLDFLLVFSVDLKYTLFLKLFYFELEEIRQFKRRKGCKWQRCEDKTLMSF